MPPASHWQHLRPHASISHLPSTPLTRSFSLESLFTTISHILSPRFPWPLGPYPRLKDLMPPHPYCPQHLLQSPLPRSLGPHPHLQDLLPPHPHRLQHLLNHLSLDLWDPLLAAKIRCLPTLSTLNIFFNHLFLGLFDPSSPPKFAASPLLSPSKSSPTTSLSAFGTPPHLQYSLPCYPLCPQHLLQHTSPSAFGSLLASKMRFLPTPIVVNISSNHLSSPSSSLSSHLSPSSPSFSARMPLTKPLTFPCNSPSSSRLPPFPSPSSPLVTRGASLPSNPPSTTFPVAIVASIFCCFDSGKGMS